MEKSNIEKMKEFVAPLEDRDGIGERIIGMVETMQRLHQLGDIPRDEVISFMESAFDIVSTLHAQSLNDQQETMEARTALMELRFVFTHHE